MARFDNKWPSGKTQWGSIKLPPYLKGYSGVAPLRAMLHPEIGSEVVIFIIDRTPFAARIAAVNPFRFYLDTALFPCPSGPVLAMLFWIAQPDRDAPFAIFDNTVDPHNQSHLQLYRDLAKQSHWHVFVIGRDNEELNWFELENTFDLDLTLRTVDEALEKFPPVNFGAAKSEFESRYSLEDLFRVFHTSP